ncbi:MAG: hypothetical protein M3453_19400, partial [Pseudomonadota bacterium]|nr:hypothetical protein [Pseudomonadota bacterium]
MYAARPYIQRTAGKDLGKGFDQYFTQTLLPDYMEQNGVDWNVVFDARGRFTEPHTRHEVPLGTLQVRNYLTGVRRHETGDLDFDVWEPRYPTLGARNRFGAILYIEKEGFTPLFAEARLAERYDIAIMSNKGMSVTASRELVQALCVDHQIPLYVLHDFDISGFSIFGTLRSDTRRFRYSAKFEVVDLGLRLGDVDGLDTEQVFVASTEKTAATLRRHGASEAEMEFLLRRRVELNAFTSDGLIAWIEQKLNEHGVGKILPDDETLSAAYRRMRRQARVQEIIDRTIAEADDTAVLVPDELGARVAAELKAAPDRSWDAVLRRIAEADHQG